MTDPTSPEPLSPAQRVAAFLIALASQPPSADAEAALARISQTLEVIEDQFSGIPRATPPPPPQHPDGRMYPPMEDFITRHPDGRITAMTRGHRLDLGADGRIAIVDRRTGAQVFVQPGVGKP